MPRIVIGDTIEISYASPNEMVEHLDAVLGKEGLPLEPDGRMSLGEERPVTLNIPWIGRQLHLRMKATGPTADGAPGALRLMDGPHDTLEKLTTLIGRFRSGSILEETHVEGQTHEQRIRAMGPNLRALLAVKANSEERLILGRDPDPRVMEYLLKNPSITLEEVRRLAGRLTLHQGHFGIIMRHSAWMGDETLRGILARNPRLPEFMAIKLLPTLPTPALQAIVKSYNTTAGTRRAAEKVLRQRGVSPTPRRNIP